MADFLISYKKTSKNEGGYVNDKNDLGGETYCGISKKNFPNWKGWAILSKYLPLATGSIVHELDSLVEEFYKTHFWIPIGGDNIQDQGLADDVYDMAVNSGVQTALKLLKES